MISDARGSHVSPGIYTEERDVTYSVKSLGITSLGLVGETLYGPAFQNVEIENWGDFVDYFGGTSPEKFKGTGLPKYELPYIAQSYLQESKRLNVVRVLGLSGYDAGPCWVIKEEGNKKAPIVVLRSKMTYKSGGGDICDPTPDKPTAVVNSIKIGPYAEKIYNAECVQKDETGKTISEPGYFSLTVECSSDVPGYNSAYTYNVNLTPGSSNYIYKVLSNRPDTGTTPVYIEAVYESSFTGEENIKGAASGETLEKVSIETVGTKYYEVVDWVSADTGYNYTVAEINEDLLSENEKEGANEATPDDDGKITYSESGVSFFKSEYTVSEDSYSDFFEGYRPAQTPWIVSDAVVKEEGEEEDKTKSASMKKLFKFITISDGDASNYQVKISIQNIKPDEGTFDVFVRDFNDTDAAPIVLERFTRCNLVEGDSGYIAFKIGSSDGGYEAKSKYITVEMAEAEDLSNSIPAGFMGYPMPDYATSAKVQMDYNVEYIPELKAKKQYFGLSDITGVDSDVFAYKGRIWYSNGGDANPAKLNKGFHMDAALNGVDSENTYVDGMPGYSFTPVSDAKVTADRYIPRLINAAYINQTLYKDINTRKFTVYFYGGFDGWDVNREQRTTGDEYKSSKYNVSGSSVFSNVIDYNGLNAPLDLPSTAITSDYYAFLAGYRVFANPQDVEINLFATPGIDWYNNTLLTEEAIDVIEDTDDGRGGDALYIMTSPSDMDATELAEEFADTEINSSYACTYAPWVMYYDSNNSRYLNLPVTKDVVRNMASTDNNSYPWYAPAGMERGNVKCIKAAYKTTLADEDVLYENSINPVKTFGKDGVRIWGNKTAYNVDSPLNRVNVRRLMIRVKKLITSAARSLIFTQYDDTLDSQFRSIVDPILSDVKSNKGISDYRIITEVTAETKDAHILPAKILVKPVNALEFLSISFVIYPESVEFDEN